MKVIEKTKLEVFVTNQWVDITGPVRNITINRADGDVGLLSAEVLDADLDPLGSATLRPGHRVRFSIKNGSAWPVQFTGLIDNVEVNYLPRGKGKKKANVKFSAADNVAFLANQTESRGVGTINELRWLLSGVPFNINGSTTPLASGTIVSTNDNASLWDQVLLTRDSVLGYAWVDKSNTLYAADSLGYTSPFNLGPEVYSNIDTDFTLDQVINSVTVNWLRYNIGTEQSASVAYGPYNDSASIAEWGVRSAAFTITGPVEVEANIAAYANSILTRAATPHTQAKSMTIPVRNIALIDSIDLNTLANVTYTDGETTEALRVTGIAHNLSATAWTVELTFKTADGVNSPSNQPGTGNSVISEGSIGLDELDDEVSDLVISAEQAATDALEAADAAAGFAQSKNQTWYQDTKPSLELVHRIGDQWFDTDDGNKLYVFNGTDYTPATTSYLQTNNGRLTITPTGLTAVNSAGTLKTSLDAGTGAFYTAGPIITGGDITGATVTGGTVQTTSAVQRGIKLNSSFLIAYNASGVPTLSIDANTGAVAMKGDLTSGSTITGASFATAVSGQRIELNTIAAGQTIALHTSNSNIPGRVYAGPTGGSTGTDLILQSPSPSGSSATSSLNLGSSGGSTTARISANTITLVGTTEVQVGSAFRFGRGSYVNGFSHGDFSGSTNSSAQITISHGMGITPNSVNITGNESVGSARHTYTVSNLNISTFTVTVRNTTMGVANTSTRFFWQAFA